MRYNQGDASDRYRERQPQPPPRGNQPPGQQGATGGADRPPAQGGYPPQRASPPPQQQPPQPWSQPAPPGSQPSGAESQPSQGGAQPDYSGTRPPQAGPAQPEQAPPPRGGGAVQPPRQSGREQRPRPPAERPRLGPVEVGEFVQTDVVTVEPSTPIATVVAQMAEEDVGSVVVVEDDAPVGVLTDRGIALALESDPDVSERTAEDLLTRDPITGSADMTVFDALGRMEEEGIRRLPIVGEDGDLEGIVTLDDILVLLGAELQNATAIIKAQSPRI